ncbi:Transforming growth factor-beta C-terminal [Trinorchestia longiramus]|nr:Transforming growth factor-beta C-terminal [Trinorchestia longiramus]
MRSSLSKRDTSPLSDIRLSAINYLHNVIVPEDVQSVDSSQEEKEDTSSNCDKCSLRLNGPPKLKTEQERDTVRELRLELVKAQILSKLRLTQPPNVTRPLVLPPEAVGALPSAVETLPDHESVPPPLISKIIVADARVPCPPSSPHNAVCFRFTLPSDTPTSTVSRSSLFFWVPESSNNRARHRHLVSVTKVSPSTVRHHRHNHHRRHHTSSSEVRSPLADRRVMRPDNGWVSINFSSPLLPLSQRKVSPYVKSMKKSSENHSKWKNKILNSEEQTLEQKASSTLDAPEDNELVLEIFCRHCGHQRPTVKNSAHMPFISVQITNEAPAKSRTRRSVQDCAASTRGCCRDSFHVNFSDLGWDDWIIQPSGFTMYFCRGSCAQPSLADALGGGNSYSSLLQRILLTDELSPAVRAAVAPCCSAHSTAPLSVMWMSSPNTVKLQHLPDMIVTECSCSG